MGVSRNPAPDVVVMYHNGDLISETYEDITTGKLQIRRFQPPHSVWRQFSEKSHAEI